ncbi:MAG: hypothetical protein IPG81_02650 [Sandaracinaceae bacterium]|nr:hypothetical protein [Sandaracinaceae bacterium]
MSALLISRDDAQADLGHEDVEHRHHAPHEPEVHRELLLHVGVLDLERHVLAVLGARAVHLAEARSVARLVFDGGEDLVGRRPELRGQAPLHVAPGQGVHLVLQLRQRARPLHRRHVHPHADELADLDEASAHAHREPVEAVGAPLVHPRPGRAARGDTQLSAQPQEQVREVDGEERRCDARAAPGGHEEAAHAG